METKVAPGAIMAVLLSKGMCHFIMFYLAASLCALLCGRPVSGTCRGCNPGRLRLKTQAIIMNLRQKKKWIINSKCVQMWMQSGLITDNLRQMMCATMPPRPLLFKYGFRRLTQSNTLVTAYWLRFLEKKRYAGSSAFEMKLFDHIWPIIHVRQVTVVHLVLAWFPFAFLRGFTQNDRFDWFLMIKMWLLWTNKWINKIEEWTGRRF